MLALHFSPSKLMSLQTTARLEGGLKEDYSYNLEVEAQVTSFQIILQRTV